MGFNRFVGGKVMQYNEEMLRAYLLRRVARKNRRISGALKQVVKSNKGSYNNGFNEILSFFCDGLNTETMNEIFNHIENNQKKRYAVYHYFDVDTLNAYDTYLQRILTETDVAAYNVGHKFATASDFSRGFKEAKSVWRGLCRERSSKNGYYNISRPVKTAKTVRDGITVLDPKKPMSDEQFAKKYDETECAKELFAYLEMKHHGRDVTAKLTTEPSPKQEVKKEVVSKKNETPTQAKKPEIYMFKYKGEVIPLEVIEKDYFVDEQGTGVTKIVAEGKEGRLYTTHYPDGAIYEGDLYDYDYRLVEVDGGGQVFYPSKVNTVSAIKEKHTKPKKTKEEIAIENGQMYFDLEMGEKE